MALTKAVCSTSIRATRIRTIIGCFLAQNAVMGLAYGSFGPLLASNQAYFGVSRAVVAMGMSLTTLSLAVVAAVAGGVMQRYQVRSVMMGGVLASAIAWFGLAYTGNFAVALACYLLLGLGVALAGILAPLALVARWVVEGRGTALSIVNLPLALFAGPFVIGAVLPDVGRTAVLTGMGCMLLLLALLLPLLVSEHPSLSAKPGRAPERPPAPQPASEIVRSAGFWLASCGIALMAGCGIVFVVHIIAFGTETGLAMGSATALLSIYAGAGLVGTPLFGWLADRLGPPNALVLSGACQAVLWSMLLMVQGPPLFLIAAGLGICCTPVVTLHGAALSALFDQATVARAMGYGYLLKLPFIFTFAPTVGALFDMTGGYRLPFLLCSGMMACATVSFLGLSAVTYRSANHRIATSR